MGIRMLTSCIFLWISAIPDLRSRKVPVCIPALFFGAAILWNILAPGTAGALYYFLGAVPGALLLVAALLTKGGIGEADGLCLITCGVWTGAENAAQVLAAAAFMAGLCSAALLITRKRDRKSTIPFLPFMAAAQSLCLAAYCLQGELY